MRSLRIILMRIVGYGLAAGMVALAYLLFTGRVELARTHGSSMAPAYNSGDLVAVSRERNYRIGDVVAYRNDLLHIDVLHRVVASADGRYTFKGDNNRAVDEDRPAENQLIGRVRLRIPHAGALLIAHGAVACIVLVPLILWALLWDGDPAVVPRTGITPTPALSDSCPT
jgi:signal peptidase I